ADRTTDVVITPTYGAPAMPSGYVYKRRIGSVVRQSGLMPFTQTGDYFQTPNGFVALNDGQYSANQAANINLSGFVPIGTKKQCHLAFRMYSTGGPCWVTFYDLDQGGTNAVPNIFGPSASIGAGMVSSLWDRAVDSNIGIIAGSPAGVYHVWVQILGYWDTREKDM